MDVPAAAPIPGADKENVCTVEDIDMRAGDDPEEVKKTIRRIDWIIIPVITVILSFCYIDRSNMGLANVAGMGKDLELVGYRYSIALLVFFVGYVTFALPSNYLMAKTKVRYWLTFISAGFGLFTLGTGFVKNYHTLVVLRLFLGIFEAGVFPAAFIITSSWYPRFYLGKRLALLMNGAGLIQAFAGILAFALSAIDVPGYAGWRWIFIVEGLMTVVAVVGAFIVLDEYPQTSRFLTPRQREVAVNLIAKEREENEDETVTLKVMARALKDWKLWVPSAIYMLSTVTVYGASYFGPLILHAQMGFSGAQSQALFTPPSVFSFFLGIFMGWMSDKYRMRSPFLAFFSILTILGSTLLRWGPNTGSQYLGLFFTVSGAAGSCFIVVSWGQNNSPTRSKRGVLSGLTVTGGAIGGIIGSTVFRSQDAPSYTPGIITVLISGFLNLCLTGMFAAYLHRQNKHHRESGRISEGQENFEYTL